jgi:hypothetical protein
MILDHPLKLIIIGFVLLVIGFLLPFLIILQVLESTFFLNFAAYLSSVSGLFLGVIGVAMYMKKR